MDTYLKKLDTTELQKAKLVIGQFITSCSHSMRGPLKSITGLVNLLQNPKDLSTQDVKMFLDLIDSTVSRMERTLDELEHFLENSKRDVVLRPIDCREMVNAVLDQYAEEISAKHIKIDLSIEQTIPFNSDMARLKVVLANIISNAIQFRDVNKRDQEVMISVSVTPLTCTFLISDNGIGIDMVSHSNIFQLFYRATERSAGTGIGLYLVKEAVEKMEGNIFVNSTPGKGSTFTIVLPNRTTALTNF